MKMNKFVKTLIDQLLKYSILFSYGGMAYMILELLFRGKTHYLMSFCGGLCFVLIGIINEFIPWKTPLWLQSIIGGLLIVTPIELVFGILFNSDYSIWDYRNLKYNFLGQISLSYSVLWCFVSLLVIIIDDYLRYRIFDDEKPVYKLF